MIATNSKAEQARQIYDAIPEDGLFHEKTWRVSPNSLPLSNDFVEELDKLGYRLARFVRACNLLYMLSVEGKQPTWISDILDRGKPDALVRYQRERRFRMDLPRVLRPDLLLTEDGYVITELDNVPGGIGLTAWLGGQYMRFGEAVVGGPDGMLEGFASILPGGDIVVSEEASTYQPEMEWLAAQLNARFAGDGKVWRVFSGESRDDWQTHVYRFFELFDLENVACAKQLIDLAVAGSLTMTPPLKPALEEKLWFALFHLRPLENFWIRELGRRAFDALKRVIPYTWLLDPAELPQQAVYPKLGIQSWDELGNFSQKERAFAVKISGFSELAWGARGVTLGQDTPQQEWKQVLANALSQYHSRPHVLQEFHKAVLIEHPWWDPAQDTMEVMKGRVRLCPFYFLGSDTDKVRCSGALATIVPADKKIIHGMRDAILVPAQAV